VIRDSSGLPSGERKEKVVRILYKIVIIPNRSSLLTRSLQSENGVTKVLSPTHVEKVHQAERKCLRQPRFQCHNSFRTSEALAQPQRYHLRKVVVDANSI
jgi:hypothetical protein